jgi:two-component system catabolic regulation response regulator CreB/two-component system response regulator ChvI
MIPQDKPRILLVDDERDIVTVLKASLQRNGFEVDGFSDPTEALANFKKDRYDLILLDIKMPKMNGFELSRELTKIDDGARMGFMSAFEINLDEARVVFPTLKALFFMRKPISVQKMVEQIRAFASI